MSADEKKRTIPNEGYMRLPDVLWDARGESHSTSKVCPSGSDSTCDCGRRTPPGLPEAIQLSSLFEVRDVCDKACSIECSSRVADMDDMIHSRSF
jgi:hypothetical protein